MRRLLALATLIFALSASRPSSAETIVNRQPMDLGANQAGTLTDMSTDLLFPPHRQTWWFDAGVSYPVGTLHKADIKAGLLLRVNHQIWQRDALGLVGSAGAMFGDNAYWNDQADDAAFNAPISIGPDPFSGYIIVSKYFMAVPMTMELQIEPPVSGTIRPFFAVGPGVIWSHDNVTVSAVNNGAGGTVSLGDTTGVLLTGIGGEQGISPFAIRTRTRFNVGWDARAGVGLRLTGGENPLWMRLVASGTTYYNHTAPRTLLGFAASFSH